MQRFWNVALGVLTMIPTLVVFGWLATNAMSMMAVVDAIEQAGDISPTLVAGPVPNVQILMAATLLAFGLLLFYLAWVIFAARMSAARKAAWIAALGLFGLVTMPVLWWRHFWIAEHPR